MFPHNVMFKKLSETFIYTLYKVFLKSILFLSF